MSGILMQLLLFSAKAIIIMLFILIVFAGILSLLGRGKERLGGKITIKNINKKYRKIKEILLQEILSKKEFKKYTKAQRLHRVC